VHELGERVLAPAFVNAHTHLAMGALRGVATASARAGNVVTDLFFHLESGLTAEDVRAFTRMGAYECLLTGSGEVWDHYYFGDAVAAGLLDVGLTGVVAPTLQDLSGPGATRWEAELEATEQLAANSAAKARGVRAALGPHATDTVSADLFARIAQSAERLRLPVHMHVAQSFEEVASAYAQYGCSPLEWLERLGVLELPSALLVHAVFASAADFSRLDPARHVVGVCPFSQLQFAVPTPVAALRAAAIPWVVGTDCVASNDSMGLQKELALLGGFGALGAAFSPAAAEHVTRGTLATGQALEDTRRAKLDDWSSQIASESLLERVWGGLGRLVAPSGGAPAGVIRPGALANLVIYDPEHPSFWPGDDVLRTLAYAETSGAIWGMLVAGVWRGAPGAFHQSIVESHEYRAAREEASARKRELFARIESGSSGVPLRSRAPARPAPTR
jgi:cytosine/adenosine deaminase-related metal-dependent hydrolase